MILKRVLLVVMIKIFKDVDDTIGYFKFLPVKIPIVILKVRSECRRFSSNDQRVYWAHLLDLRILQNVEYPRIAQRNRAQSADCADPATAPNTSMSAKHSMFILSRGDMVRHEVGVCVYTWVRCACAVNLRTTSPIMLRITLGIPGRHEYRLR